MKNRIIRIGGFLAILLVLLAAAGLIFQPKNNNSAAGVKKEQLSALGILAEPANTIDVVFLGDSEAYCAFMPLRIWANAGIPTYASCTVDEKLYETVEYMKKAFENQSPKIIVLETNAIYRYDGLTEELMFRGKNILQIFEHHDRWKKLRRNDLSLHPEYTAVREDKGYHHSMEAKPAEHIGGYMAYTDEIEAIPAANIRILQYMRDYCVQHGAELILVSSPSTMNWDWMRHNAVAQEAERLGLTYIDMNLLREEVPIDWETDTLDRGDHVNFYGSLKVSDYMTRCFAKTGLFEDGREKAEYQPWNQAADSFFSELTASGVTIPEYTE